MPVLAADLIAFATIVARGYLFLSGNAVLGALLDIAMLPVFVLLALHRRRFLYHGVVVYLAASSIFFLPIGAIPFDLSLLIAFLVIVQIVRPTVQAGYDPSLRTALLWVALLCLYLLGTLVLTSINPPTDLQGQIKAIYYLANAGIAGFLFSRVYEPVHASPFQRALLAAALGYFVAGTLGYLFPLEQYTWQLASDYKYKSLFRYPGLSSSNYVAQILLMLVMIHHALAETDGRRPANAPYIVFIAVVAVVSQSRGFAVTALLLLLLWQLLPLLRAGTDEQDRRQHRSSSIGLGLALICVGFVLSMFSEFVIDLVTQTLDRFTLRDISTVNIDSRLQEWAEAYRHIVSRPGSEWFGNLTYTDSIRPHNVILSAFFLLGVPLGAITTLLLFALAARYPLMLVILFGAQAEILFFTGPYDCIVLLLLVILARRTVAQPGAASGRRAGARRAQVTGGVPTA